MTWLGGIIVGASILNAVMPRYTTINTHPDLIRDSSCQAKLTEAYVASLKTDDWYERGITRDYLKETIYWPCQAELVKWYMDNYPEYNKRVRKID